MNGCEGVHTWLIPHPVNKPIGDIVLKVIQFLPHREHAYYGPGTLVIPPLPHLHPLVNDGLDGVNFLPIRKRIGFSLLPTLYDNGSMNDFRHVTHLPADVNTLMHCSYPTGLTGSPLANAIHGSSVSAQFEVLSETCDSLGKSIVSGPFYLFPQWE
jgi:hypothetical protein